MTLWPVAQAVGASDLAAALTALAGTAVGVGANLIANQVQSWKDETDAGRSLAQAAAESTQVREALDAVLAELDVLREAQAALAEVDRAWFAETLRAELARLGGSPRLEAQLAAFDQRAQVVHGPQTNVAGDVDGSVLPGEFGGPVAVGKGAESIDFREATGVVFKPTGPVIQIISEKVAPSPPLYTETLPRPKCLYDRKRILEEGYEALSRRHSLGVWLRSSEGRGRTRLAIELAWRCLGWHNESLQNYPRPFNDCIYYRSASSSPKFAYFLEFLTPKLLRAQKNLEDRILLVIDDVDLWHSFERELLTEYLSGLLRLREKWKAILVSCEGDDGEEWHEIPITEQLSQDDAEAFVRDYVEDAERSGKSKLKDELERVGRERWWPKLYSATRDGNIEALLAALEEMRNGEQFSDVLWWLHNLSETDNPIVKRTREAMEKLDQDHRRVLSALSLFATSASLGMLGSILDRSSGQLMPVLGRLVRQSLIEATTDGTKRYQLAGIKRKTIAEECEQIEDLFPRFIKWWLKYAQKHGASYKEYPKLSAEHDNLMDALGKLWNRANIRIRNGYNPDDIDDIKYSEPLPLDAFRKIERSAEEQEEQAAKQYIEMREHLRNYLRFGGYWLDYRRSAKRAYAAACALGRMDDVAWEAAETAYTYSLEGRYDTQELEIAKSWIVRVEETIDEGKLAEMWYALTLRVCGAISMRRHKEVWRALARRMRGVIAMRRHDYRGSLGYFQDALNRLEKLDPKDTNINKDIEDLQILLAKLRMRYSPNVLDKRFYEAARKCLEKAIGSAKTNGHPEQEAIARTCMAELMTWWGEWDDAAQVLEKVLPLSGKLGRKDLLAKGLYLDAFVYQHRSESKSGSSKRNLLLKAIRRAERSLEVLLDTPTPELFLNLFSTYLLLAGLYRSKQSVSGNAEDGKFKDYLSKAHEVPEMHRISEPDPGASYEEACYKITSGGFDEAEDILFAALRVQPGLYVRAGNDFRLDPLTKGERWWELKEDLEEDIRKPPEIIGGVRNDS